MNEVVRDVDTGQAVPQPKQPKKPKAKKIILIVVALLILGGVFLFGYWLSSKNSQEIIDFKQSEVNDLKAQVTKLEADLETAKAGEAKNTKPATGPDQETLDMLSSAVNDGKVEDIQEHMADKVLVILAASEGLGTRTPAQAIADIKDQTKDAKQPWDFELSEETLNSYSSGDYAQYFPAGALVGESADGTVISFIFNNEGHIRVIFVAADSSLL